MQFESKLELPLFSGFTVVPFSQLCSFLQAFFVVLTTSSGGFVGFRSFFCRPVWGVDRWSLNHWMHGRGRCPWRNGLRPKKLFTSVTVTSAPVRIPTQRPLVPRFTSVVGQVENFPPCLRMGSTFKDLVFTVNSWS